MTARSPRPIRFGALLRQADNRWESIAKSACIADDLGSAPIQFIDHLLGMPDPAGDILESWTTMTACVAEQADVWNASAGNYAQLDRKIEVLRDHCRAISRDPASIELSLQDLVVIAPTDAALRAPMDDARRRLGFFGDVDAIATWGTPDRCVDTIRRKISQGITYFVCLFTDGGQPDTVRLFGERVLPAFR